MTGLPRTRLGQCTPPWLHLFTALFPIACCVLGILAAELVIRRTPVPVPMPTAPHCRIA